MMLTIINTPAHRWSAGFLLVRLRSVFADVLADLQLT